MLNSTFHVATEIARARAGVPLSDAESRAARSLKGAAERLGFQLDAPALKAQGRRGRHQQLADVSMNYHHDGAWTTEFEVRYPQPLGLGIKLLPQRGFWASVGEFFGTQDIEVGHPAFDATFKVKGQPEDRVAELLQGDVAGKILSLHAVAKELNVGDEGVHATAAGLMDDAGSLVRSLEVVSDIAEAIAHRAFGGPTAPYR
jgi:hypothetical protein